eukprot:910081-Pleurochrysis_carterae.AAC.1
MRLAALRSVFESSQAKSAAELAALEFKVAAVSIVSSSTHFFLPLRKRRGIPYPALVWVASGHAF